MCPLTVFSTGFRASGFQAWREVQAQKLQSPDNIVGINAPKWPNYEAVAILACGECNFGV